MRLLKIRRSGDDRYPILLEHSNGATQRYSLSEGRRLYAALGGFFQQHQIPLHE